jgi:branched-chain amino acid transport system substrate-binding protein
VAIIGDMTSATTLAAVPVCEKNGVVIISPVASSPKLTGAGKFVYRIWPPDTFEASFTANWLIQKAYSRVTVVYLLDDFGVPLKDAFRTAFESRKGEIAIEEGYPKGTTDFRTLLLKVRGSVKGIYLISHYSDAAQFVRQAKVLGIDTPIVGTSDLLNDEFVRQGGAAVEGVYFPQRKGFDPDGSSTQTQRFVEAFSKRFGRKPGLVEGQAYDAAGLVFATIRNGARTGAEIKQQFDKLANNPYQGVTGALSFDGHGDLTFSAAGFRMGRIQNGKFTALD